MEFTEQQTESLSKEVSYSASRSGGPGGQHVNKVSTRIELRFMIGQSLVLTDEQKEIIRKKLIRRINFADELLVVSQNSRSQSANKEDAFQKFIVLLQKALTPPKPRIKTKPSASSKEKRLQDKKMISEKKGSRKSPEL